MYLLIVTGVSGAGKSNAIHKLEDMGFYCVDNMPCEMIENFINICGKASKNIENAAVVIDSRESVFCFDYLKLYSVLENYKIEYETLFLECSDDVLMRRYSETRRRHPMSESIVDGITKERDMLQIFKDKANYIIDTSAIKPNELGAKLEELFYKRSNSGFQLLVESFGFKRGIPLEADFVVDMRFSPNPFYDVELRNLSGMDKPVEDYIMRDDNFKKVIDTYAEMIDMLIPQFKKQGKNRLMIAFGCTGGRHRSVCAANKFEIKMREKFNTKIIHRDLINDGIETKLRFEQ